MEVIIGIVLGYAICRIIDIYKKLRMYYALKKLVQQMEEQNGDR